MRMKTRWIIALVMLLSGCFSYPSKAPLKSMMQQHDPARVTLEQGYNDYVHRAILEDGTEIGIIQIKDNSSSKFWFRSHHLVDDIGGTWFQMSDGTTSYMAGWFCCEVQLPEKQLKSLDELKEFICQHHGDNP